MKKIPVILIFAGFITVLVEFIIPIFGNLLSGHSYHLNNTILYLAGIILPVLAIVITATQLVLLALRKYKGLLKFVIPELILLGYYLLFAVPLLFQAGNLLLPAPKTAAEGVEQINSCKVWALAVNPSLNGLLIEYVSGRYVVVDKKLWPQLHDAALKDAGQCGFQENSPEMVSVPRGL